jgi:hypothetical protein
VVEIAGDHLAHDRRHRRHDRRHHNRVDARGVDVRELKETGQHQAGFVGGPFAQRQQPPAVRQRRAVEDTDNDVRVTDVDR